MTPEADTDLLTRYAAQRDEAAFAALVERYLSLVYFAALRQLGGDAHRAEEVAQTVFTRLAGKASSLARHQSLAGWLHTTTRYAASEARRTEARRLAREHEAHTMHELTTEPGSPADWDRLRPIIDEVLNELSAADREAVLLRFFANQPLAAVGARLQLSENAARMRIDRALDKLQAHLARRGIGSTAAALSAVLGHQAAAAVPAGLAASITTAALAGAAATAGGTLVSAHLLTTMSTSKLVASVASVLALAASALVYQQHRDNSALREEVATSRRQSEATIAALRADGQRLAADRASERDQARAEHTELIRLRAGLEAYRKQQAARAAAATAPAASPASGSSSLAPGMITVDVMQNAGRTSPTAAAETQIWAWQHGDVKTAASVITFTPEDRAKLEQFIATLPDRFRGQFSTPEELMSTVLAGNPRPISGVQLIGQDQVSPDEIVHHVQFQLQDGEVRRDDIHFVRDPNGWKQVIGTATVDKIIAHFKNP